TDAFLYWLERALGGAVILELGLAVFWKLGLAVTLAWLFYPAVALALVTGLAIVVMLRPWNKGKARQWTCTKGWKQAGVLLAGVLSVWLILALAYRADGADPNTVKLLLSLWLDVRF